MKITQISIGKSVQVFQIGQEYWNKFGVVAEVDDTESPEKVIDDLHKIIEAAHEKYSQSVIQGKTNGDIYFNVTTQKEER